MTITNKELAECGSFPIASTYAVCPKCNYVGDPFELDDLRVPCPNCKAKGEAREIFPDGSCIELLEMIAYFYRCACNRIEELQSQLTKEVQEKLGISMAIRSLIDTSNEIREHYQKFGGAQPEYDRVLEIIQNRLKLQSNEEAQRVFATLFQYSETVYEHKVVVILTVVLLEELFYDLLILLHNCRGMTWQDAYERVDRERRFDDRAKDFKKTSGVPLKKAIDECSIPNFFSDLKNVLKARNNFIHQSPFAIESKTAETAFNLAKNAFSIFAYLQTRFCVKPPKINDII